MHISSSGVIGIGVLVTGTSSEVVTAPVPLAMATIIVSPFVSFPPQVPQTPTAMTGSGSLGTAQGGDGWFVHQVTCTPLPRRVTQFSYDMILGISGDPGLLMLSGLCGRLPTRLILSSVGALARSSSIL
jgi:hypothetical protein